MPKVRSRRRKLAKGPRGFRQRGGEGWAWQWNVKLSRPVWSDRVAVGPVDPQLAGDQVAPLKLHLGERDPTGPALAKLGSEFGVGKLDPDRLGGFNVFVDVGRLLASLLMNVLCYTSNKYCDSKVYRKQSRIVTTGGALFPRSAIRAIANRAECSTQVGLRNRLAARAPGCEAFFRTASRLARKKPRGFRQRGHWRTLCCSRTYAHVGVRRWQTMVNRR